MENELEKFVMRIALIRDGQDRAFQYLYNREALQAVVSGIPIENYDQSKFIMIGQKFKINDKNFEVMEVQLKLEDKMADCSFPAGFNVLSPTDPTDYNCQLSVTIKEI